MKNKNIKKIKKKILKKFKKNKLYFKCMLTFLSILIIFLIISLIKYNYNYKYGRRSVDFRLPLVIGENYKKLEFEAKDQDVKVFKEIVYEGKTEEEVIEQINKSLTSTLTGTGEIFVRNSLEMGVDPYVAVAISLYETGCKWGCSYLARECYNFGGIKGSPNCDGTSFKRFNSLEEGIESFVRVVASYYNNGMDTPEKMQYRYAGGSTTWAGKVNAYVNQIKSK